LVRPRLLDQLARRFSVPVTVVVAGAGFGKSTLLAQALRANEADPRGVDAWVSCEPGDGDAAHLAQAILAALRRHSERRDPADGVLEALAQIAPVDVCVTLDDVHELPAGSSGAKLLADVARALPPHAHLVLAGRQRPSVPLTRRRAAGQVVELGVEELAFSAAETAALARRLGHGPTRAARLAGLAGWPSLVRLSLSAPDGAAPQYLWEEIVAALEEADRRALLALGALGWGTRADVEEVAGCAPLDLDRLADNAPLVHRGGDGWFGVHHLWEDAVERIGDDADRHLLQQRALALFRRRGETLRTGWRAVRWGDADAFRAASMHLVADTLGALPIDTAARWVAEAPADATGSPELDLLRLALLHARHYDDDRLPAAIDDVVDRFARSGEQLGAAVAIAFGAVAAHTCGDEPRLVLLEARARELPPDAELPVLSFLHGAMTAAVTSMRGEVDATLEAIGSLAFDDVPRTMGELLVRMRVFMLSLAGRADDAVAASAGLLDSPSPFVRTIPAAVRWLSGDPTAYPGGRFDSDPGPGTNERYHLYHAVYGSAVAASFGDTAVLDELRPVIEKAATMTVDARDGAMIAVAAAQRLVTEHDETAAIRVIGEHIDAHGDDRLSDVHLRRNLAVAYVCDARVRARWQVAPLGPSHVRQRAIADDLLAARAGTLEAASPLADAGLVLTALPLPWSVELAARATAAGCARGRHLAVGLADLAPDRVRAEIEQLLGGGADEPLRRGAAMLVDVLPAASAPTVRIDVLGELRVRIGDDVDDGELNRRRVRMLLELLVLDGPVRRDRLADLLWPELDASASGRNLRVTLSRLRAVLAPGRPRGGTCDAVRIDGEHVSLAPPPCVEVDLWRFRRDVEDADAAAQAGDPAGVVAGLERALGRWRGDPFGDVADVAEVAGAVDQVRRLLTDTALRLGEVLLVAGRFDEAARWAQRVTAASPFDERARRLAIAAHLQRDDRPAVTEALRDTRRMLAEVGVDPEPGTRMLFRHAEDHLQLAETMS
jgi:DNA-binding SARP family transcriptional activator